MVDLEHRALSKDRQYTLLGISRSSVYYRPLGSSRQNPAVMKRIDQKYQDSTTEYRQFPGPHCLPIIMYIQVAQEHPSKSNGTIFIVLRDGWREGMHGCEKRTAKSNNRYYH